MASTAGQMITANAQQVSSKHAPIFSRSIRGFGGAFLGSQGLQFRLLALATPIGEVRRIEAHTVQASGEVALLATGFGLFEDRAFVALQQGRGVLPGRIAHSPSGQRCLESSCPSFGIRNLYRRRYADECGTGGSGFFMGGGTSVPCARRRVSEALLACFAMRQRENSWQYLASSRAASL